MSLIRILLIILVVYYLFKWMVKLVLPHVIKQQMDKFQDQFNQQNPDLRQNQQKKEGTVTVEQVQPKTQQSKDDGEYVDFEEIK